MSAKNSNSNPSTECRECRETVDEDGGILCTGCGKRFHITCAKLEKRTRAAAQSFVCSRCMEAENMATAAQRTEQDGRGEMTGAITLEHIWLEELPVSFFIKIFFGARCLEDTTEIYIVSRAAWAMEPRLVYELNLEIFDYPDEYLISNVNLSHCCSSYGTSMKRFKGIHINVFLLTWLWYALVVTSSYSGNLISYLTFETREKQIDTMDDLARVIRKSGFKAAAVKGSNLEKELLEFTTGQRKIISSNVLSLSMSEYKSRDDLLDIFLSEKRYVLYNIGSTFEVAAKNRGMDHQLYFGKPIRDAHSSIAFPKYYPYQEDFNIIIRRLNDAGIISYWKDSSIRTMTKGSQSKHQMMTEKDWQMALKLIKLEEPFMILACGCAISMVVLLFERVWLRWR